MTIVRIVKDWEYPDLMRQTPGGKGIWDGIQFTTEAVAEVDYLIVLNRPKDNIKVKCPSGHKWILKQEPPIPYYEWHYNSYKHFDLVITPGDEKRFQGQVSSQTALPWHVNKSFDSLVKILEPDDGQKLDQISWITSNASVKKGHQIRMMFKDYLEKSGFPFRLYGRGFDPIMDKFDGIFPYKYSIAIENCFCRDYWTEKLADCFLSWTMPVYGGCTNITDYFPEKSMVRIDPENPKEALKIIETAIKENWWLKNLEYIKQARNLILFEYQLFPFLANRIKIENKDNISKAKEMVFIPRNRAPYESSLSANRIVRKVGGLFKWLH